MLSIKEIETLIEKLDKSTIDEFTYEVNGAKVKLKKNRSVVEQAASNVTEKVVNRPESTQPKEEPVQDTKKVEEEVAVETIAYDYEIVSPMVGTFYSSPSPDKPVFVQAGDQVEKNTIVCIVEAMKLFNEIEADVKGTITEVLVENGELVEYGQPLFRIKTK
ncbi:acetyl-CoA carboxylase biotin carboxyl carrier protein [Gracilibacillus marinus]|jgi:acetyl-CoA carboxylase biotin carboxyl carrier protein|uniref:Biotin carboxyl carrier protein of acetyl-CoA carboxylase n=1 Tax=Gracilibacillus marinus TaxID=630535 RepID=A0ABV8VVL1_9BACI